ncbi:uncharacterized protein LOC122508461 isoform X2 [Leptopilina heterotoma]|nr:uncharacterized protein LOC122508461 isoform X2 [Leptopilina heterotoma]
MLMVSSTIGDKLETIVPAYFRSLQEPVLINFPKRNNLTRGAMAQRFYLPPEVPSVLRPEIIDNKLRSSSWIHFHKLSSQPNLNLQTPFQIDQEDNFYKFGRPQQITDDSNTEFVKVNEMSCRNSDDEIYFRVSLTPLRRTGQPIIENTGSDSCEIKNLQNEYKIDLDGNQFWNCGVTECSNGSDSSYCLNLRFPLITGLKLKEDFKITLQCRGQDKIVSHVKKISINSLDTTGKMLPKIETGGYKSDFQTDVALYRKTFNSENVFDTRIESGGTVILGEEILLRVLVREGDGWQYSKISDVTIYFVERRQRRKIMNSVSILDTNGCLNPEIRSVCSREQYRVSPLESYLLFKAFMFENMKENDEMIISVKVIGCLDGADCILNCPAGHLRSKRNTPSQRNQTIKFENDIEFKVILPTTEEHAMDLSIIIYILSALILISIVILIYVVTEFIKQNYHRSNSSNLT